MTLGKRIHAARKKAGLTQAQLAELCGIATITVQQYERDKRNPRGDTLEAIASALNVDIYQLFLGMTAKEWQAQAESEVDNYWSEMEEAFLPGLAKVLVEAFNQLNDEGQQKAVERVEELTEIPKYKK